MVGSEDLRFAAVLFVAELAEFAENAEQDIVRGRSLPLPSAVPFVAATREFLRRNSHLT
jgi:hypothetical protein